jgi:hypothetical protein
VKLALVALAAVIFIPNGYATTLHSATPRAYAYELATHRGWTGERWRALNEIVRRESHWNPCRHYPSTTDCTYSGINACGIPQRVPCPPEWRGRLAVTWRAQVRELFRYITRRYGDPLSALAWWDRNGYY